jgi:hypothetical protein
MAAGLGLKTFVTGDVLTAADTNGYLMQGVWVFASAAARTAAVTSPQEGNMSYLKDTNSTEYYSGSAWVAVGAAGGLKPMTLLNSGGTTLTGSATITISGISNQQAILVIIDAASCVSAGQIGVRINGISTNNYRQAGIQTETSGNQPLNATTGRWIFGDIGDASLTLSGGLMISGTNAAGIMAMTGTGMAVGSGRIGNASTGYFDAAAAVTSISANAAANFDSGTIYVYGMSA